MIDGMYWVLTEWLTTVHACCLGLILGVNKVMK